MASLTTSTRERAAPAAAAPAPLSREELRRRLDALPRVPLVHRPGAVPALLVDWVLEV